MLDTPLPPRRIAACAPRLKAGARLEAAIPPLANLRRARARLALSAALVCALLPALQARADFYRWTDADGVTHYSQDLERVPRRYRSSVQIVKPHASAAQGPLPVLEIAPGPGEDDAGFEEPGLGERAPAPPDQPRVETGSRAPEPLPAEVLPAQALPADVDPRQAEIAELERELEARREELKSLISQSSFDSSQIATDPRLRELAESVPRLQAELEALRGELDR
jgi:hypothetical protein